jgi:hypothetical protein
MERWSDERNEQGYGINMAAAMELYAGFALVVISIVAIIAAAALISNLIGALRRRFGKTPETRAHDDF